MAFSFGGFAAGLAETVTEKVKEDEKRVNLLVDKAVDYHTRDYLARKKDREKEVEETRKTIDALSMYFGDDPDGLEKAASIARMGNTYSSEMLSLFKQAQLKGKSANDIYMYTPNPEKEGLDSSLAYADAIVKAIDIPEVQLGAVGEARTLFGPDPTKLAQRRMREQQEMGILPMDTATREAATFGTAKVDYTGIADAPSLAQQFANVTSRMSTLDPTSDEYQTAVSEKDRIVKDIREYQAATTTPDITSESTYRLIFNSTIDKVEDNIGWYAEGPVVMATDRTTGQRVEGEEAYAVLDRANDAAKLQFVRNVTDENGIPVDKNAARTIKNLGLSDQLVLVQKEKTGEKEDKAPEPPTPPKPQTDEEKAAAQAKKVREQFPEPLDYARAFRQNKNTKDAGLTTLFDEIMRIYEYSAEDAQTLVDTIFNEEAAAAKAKASADANKPKYVDPATRAAQEKEAAESADREMFTFDPETGGA